MALGSTSEYALRLGKSIYMKSWFCSAISANLLAVWPHPQKVDIPFTFALDDYPLQSNKSVTFPTESYEVHSWRQVINSHFLHFLLWFNGLNHLAVNIKDTIRLI